MSFLSSAGLFSKEYVSAPQTVTAAGQLVLAHGLGIVPRYVHAWLKCQVAVLGYAVGQEVNIGAIPADFGSAGGYGLSCVPDATNLTIRMGSAVGAFVLTNATTGALATLTATDWKLIIKAFG